jgi:acyl-CoA synthetase (AMP-forming)/AMP-acid ligase II
MPKTSIPRERGESENAKPAASVNRDNSVGNALDNPIDIPALLAGLHERLSAIPRHWAALTPDADALCDGQSGLRWTYAQLSNAVDAAAQTLQQLGLRPGDRLMVVGENCAAQVALTFAAAAIDAWIVHVNARLSNPEVDAIALHSGARRVLYTIAGAAHGARCNALPTSFSAFSDVLAGPLNDECVAEPVAASSALQVAALIYTTGTTGTPKGVMLSHRNLLFIAAVSSTLRGLERGDRAYGVLPISHVYGLASVMLGTLQAGACLVLAPRFSPAALLTSLEQDKLTILQGVPAMYARLLEAIDQPADQPSPALASKLRFIYAGGSPLDPRLKNAVEQWMGLPLHNGYGMTESAPTISQTRLAAPRNDNSVGLPIPGVEVRLVDQDGNAAIPGASGDAQGELWVRGPNVMLGYYREPALTAAVMRDGDWLNTGDIARQDQDGALFIAGRTKEIIIRSGFNVYPLEVETVLNAHPAVIQSAVVGRAMVNGNEEVIAFVELDQRSRVDSSSAGSNSAQPSVAELQAHLALSLAPYKCPSELIIMEALPCAATGKILKHRLRELAQRRIEN